MYNWLVVSTRLKNISQLGWLFPIYGKIKNVPNHQPDNMRSRTAFCFADMRLLVWTNVFHLSMLTIYGNVWWENDRQMMGKWWANDGKTIGTWWVAMNMWVCFQIYMASSDAAGIPHGCILGLFLKNDNASKLLGVLPLHHSGHEISHWTKGEQVLG